MSFEPECVSHHILRRLSVPQNVNICYNCLYKAPNPFPSDEVSVWWMHWAFTPEEHQWRLLFLEGVEEPWWSSFRKPAMDRALQSEFLKKDLGIHDPLIQ